MDERKITYTRAEAIAKIYEAFNAWESEFASSAADFARFDAEYEAVIDALSGPDSLDAAWAEAEAALPEGWMLEVVHRGALTGDINPWTGYAVTEARTRYVAEAAHAWHGGPSWTRIEPPAAKADGDTPAAALRALAAKLRERAG